MAVGTSQTARFARRCATASSMASPIVTNAGLTRNGIGVMDRTFGLPPAVVKARQAGPLATRGALVEVLQQVVRGERDGLVAPLRGAEVARDDRRPVDPAEIAEHE